MNIDPGVITLVQTNFLQQLESAFAGVSGYALNLLYIFAGFEAVVVGITWALQNDAIWGQAFFKIIKIGLIFVIIQNYPYLVNIVINSFAMLAGIIVNKSKLATLIFNPAQIWQYGYDAGLHLLQSAIVSSGIGLTSMLSLLGMGILLVFGLLGIQMVVQLVGFYLVALVGLIMLPLGVFAPSRKMFDRAVQAVLQAGVRVMTVFIVIGVATLVWNNFDLIEMTKATVNLNQILGLFFSALLFLFLAIYLPRFTAAAVGEIGGHMTMPNITVETNTNMSALMPSMITACDLANIQAATSVGVNVEADWRGMSSVPASSAMMSITHMSDGVGVFNNGSRTSDLIWNNLLAKNNMKRTVRVASNGQNKNARKCRLKTTY